MATIATLAISSISFVGWIALAITAIGLLSYYIYKNWDDIKIAFNESIDWIGLKWDKFILNMLKLPNYISKIWNNIRASFSAAIDWIGFEWDDFILKLTHFDLGETLGKGLSDVWDNIKTAFSEAMDWIGLKWDELILKLTHFDLGEILGKGLSDAFDWVSSKIDDETDDEEPPKKRKRVSISEEMEKITTEAIEKSESGKVGRAAKERGGYTALKDLDLERRGVETAKQELERLLNSPKATDKEIAEANSAMLKELRELRLLTADLLGKQVDETKRTADETQIANGQRLADKQRSDR